MSTAPGFGWRDIKPGEVLPSEYMFFDGQAWVHRRCSPLEGHHWESYPNLERIKIRMTEEEVRAVPMSWELWNEMTVDERFLYNRAAFDADIQGKPVERWHAGWLGCPFTFGSDLHFPFRPWEESSRARWYLLKYPDGTVLGFDKEEKAQHAAVGQDVVLIVAQEVVE